MRFLFFFSALFSLALYGRALVKSRFQELLVPLNLYDVPKSVTPMKRMDLYKAVATRGLPLRIAREDFSTAHYNYQLVYDNYLPKPGVTSALSYSLTPIFGGNQIAKSATLGLGVNATTPWGITYGLSLPNISETGGGTAGVGSTSYTDSISDTFSFGANLGISLLKGSYFFKGDADIGIGNVDLQIARQNLRSAALQALTAGEQAFYDVLLKQIKIQIFDISLRTTKALLEDVHEMIKAGEAERLSVIKVQLQLAQTETDLFQAENDLENARLLLKSIIAQKEANASALFPDPKELKTLPELPTLSEQEAIEKAKKQRPDYLIAQFNRRRSELDEKKAYSSTLPSLDIKSFYGYGGADDALGRAASKALKMNSPQYSIGATFAYNFLNDTDKNAYTTARITTHRSELTLENLQNDLTKEISSALKGCHISQKKLKTSELARSLSEQKLNAEFEKFRAGESNIRNIIDYQSELNNARIAELGSRIDVLKTQSQLRTSLGELPPGIRMDYAHD